MFDRETQLYYAKARYYDPVAGRWLSEDPLGFGGGDANLYRYVGNSPTNGTDPSGLLVPGTAVATTASGAALGAVVGGVGYVVWARMTGQEMTSGGFLGAVAGGAAAGLAGGLEVLAVHGAANASLIAGYGYTGILVAFLARQQPLACVPVAVLLGGIGAAGSLLQRRLDLPDATTLVLQGILFICSLAADSVPIKAWRARRKVKEVAAPTAMPTAVVAAPEPAAAPVQVATLPSKPTTSVVVLGDAMADWLGHGLDEAFADSPEFGVVRKIRPNSGLIRGESRTDHDWVQSARDLLDKAKQRAYELIDQFPAGSQFTILAACGDLESLTFDPLETKDDAQEAVGRIEIVDRAARIANIANLARRAADRRP